MAAHQRHREVSCLIDHDDAGVGVLVGQQWRDEARGGAQCQVGDDQVAFAPGGHQACRGGAVVALRLDAEGLVDLVGLVTGAGGVDHLADDRGAVRAVGTGIACRLGIIGARGIRVAGQLRAVAHCLGGLGGGVEDEHHIGAGQVILVHGQGSSLVEHADALVGLAESLGDHEVLVAAAKGCHQLGESLAGGGEHADLRMHPGDADRCLDAARVGAHQLGIVPGQGHGREGGLQ